MKINFKTITGKKYEIETDPSQTIANVKSVLQNDFGFPSTISLLYQSNLLDDSQTIGSINFAENSFIVIYKGKIPVKKNTNDISNANKSIIENNPSNAKSDTKTIEEQTINTEASKQIHSSPIKNLLLTNKTNFGDPPDFKDKVEQLKVLGYGEGDCENALRASLYQVDLAADFLVAGNIPDVPKPINLDETLATLRKNSEEEEEEENENVQYLNDLIFLKKTFQEHPENFAEYVSQLEANNPEIVRTIRRDPALFLYQLELDPSKFDIESVKKPSSKYEELMNQFNSEEKNAIHRIESNGFDTMTVIQVYIACDKNEELTNSCLISMRT